MLRFFVKIISNKDYSAEETREFAQNQQDFFKLYFRTKIYNIDSGKNWYVIFLDINAKEIKRLDELLRKEGYMKEEYYTRYDGFRHIYSIKDMDNKGRICTRRSASCKRCPYSSNGNPCRLGCTERPNAIKEKTSKEKRTERS